MEPSSTILSDEEFARQLQALDNGLRRRANSSSLKRNSTSLDDATTTTTRNSGTRRNKKSHIQTPSEQTGESHSSPESPAFSEPEHSPQPPVSCDNFCQGCGKLLTESSVLSPGVAALSKENFLNCSTCVVLYAIPPSPGGQTFAHAQASPPHRCKLAGCSLTFLFADKLHDHRVRVHGRK